MRMCKQSCQPLRKNRICYESRKGIRQYESASKKYEFTKPKKKKKNNQQQKIETSLIPCPNPYTCTQCSACNTRGRMIMEWIRTSATYTKAELKSARACKPPQWVTPSGTSWISSPGCRRWVDGETVEVLHVHCFLSRMQQCHEHDRWTRFISSITLRWTWLYFNGYFIHFVTLHLTYRNFGADIFWHSWIFHFLIAENVVGDFHVMIFCAAAMSWHTAELAWISPQGVGGVLMGKPLKFCMCTASSRSCMHNILMHSIIMLTCCSLLLQLLLTLLYVLYTCMLTVLLQPFTRAIYNCEFSASFKLEWLVSMA